MICRVCTNVLEVKISPPASMGSNMPPPPVADYSLSFRAMTMWITNDPQYINQHAVGFSGVIFTLALIECHGSSVPYRHIFGFIRVPTKLYPWALLVVLSVSSSDAL